MQLQEDTLAVPAQCVCSTEQHLVLVALDVHEGYQAGTSPDDRQNSSIVVIGTSIGVTAVVMPGFAPPMRLRPLPGSESNNAAVPALAPAAMGMTVTRESSPFIRMCVRRTSSVAGLGSNATTRPVGADHCASCST